MNPITPTRKDVPMTDAQPSIHDRLEAATGLNGDTLRGQLADQGLTVVDVGDVPSPAPARVELEHDPAVIRGLVDERTPEPVDAPGAVAVRLQAELADVRHTLRLRSDALARVTREADALRAKVAAVEALLKAGAGWLWVGEPEGWAVLVSDLRAALTTGEGK